VGAVTVKMHVDESIFPIVQLMILICGCGCNNAGKNAAAIDDDRSDTTRSPATLFDLPVAQQSDHIHFRRKNTTYYLVILRLNTMRHTRTLDLT
jgi:hypothetical protein